MHIHRKTANIVGKDKVKWREFIETKSEIYHVKHYRNRTSRNAIITPAEIQLRSPTVVYILAIFLCNLRCMDKSKTRPISNYVKPSCAIFSVSLAVCFVALIQVEIELHAHRETLKVLIKTERATSRYERSPVVTKMLWILC